LTGTAFYLIPLFFFSLLPVQFATPVAVSINPNNAGRVFHTAKGNVWVVRIQSEGAHSLSLIFDKYDLPQVTMVFFFFSILS